MAERKQRPLWPIVAAALIALPVLYVLSIGPATRALALGYLSRESYYLIYGPLIYEHLFDDFGQWRMWYLNFWIPS